MKDVVIFINGVAGIVTMSLAIVGIGVIVNLQAFLNGEATFTNTAWIVGLLILVIIGLLPRFNKLGNLWGD